MRTSDLILSLLADCNSLLVNTSGARPLDSDFDLSTFALILLAKEQREYIHDITPLQLELNNTIELIHKHAPDNWPHAYLYADKLSLLITSSILNNDSSFVHSSEVVSMLGHHSSSVRLHAFKCLWFVRQMAWHENVINILLGNVADTLGYVDYCIGLLYGIFEDDDYFFVNANLFEPEDFDVQYIKRIDALKEDPTLLKRYMQLFYELELQVRKRVMDASVRQ